jgi:hypothetical protein
MKQIAKSFLLNVPANVAYEATKKVDSSRYVSDLVGTTTPNFIQDVPNTLLITEDKGPWGFYVRNEISFRRTNETSCEMTLKVDFNNVDENVMKLILANVITAYLMLDFGYNSPKSNA